MLRTISTPLTRKNASRSLKLRQSQHLHSSCTILARNPTYGEKRTDIPRSESPKARQATWTEQEKEDEKLTKLLLHNAGGTFKQRLKGVLKQEEYLEEQTSRLDKLDLTNDLISHLPPLTETDLLEFYEALLSSGTEEANFAPATDNSTVSPFEKLFMDAGITIEDAQEKLAERLSLDAKGLGIRTNATGVLRGAGTAPRLPTNKVPKQQSMTIDGIVADDAGQEVEDLAFSSQQEEEIAFASSRLHPDPLREQLRAGQITPIPAPPLRRKDSTEPSTSSFGQKRLPKFPGVLHTLESPSLPPSASKFPGQPVASLSTPHLQPAPFSATSASPSTSDSLKQSPGFASRVDISPQPSLQSTTTTLLDAGPEEQSTMTAVRTFGRSKKHSTQLSSPQTGATSTKYQSLEELKELPPHLANAVTKETIIASIPNMKSEYPNTTIQPNFGAIFKLKDINELEETIKERYERSIQQWKDARTLGGMEEHDREVRLAMDAEKELSALEELEEQIEAGLPQEKGYERNEGEPAGAQDIVLDGERTAEPPEAEPVSEENSSPNLAEQPFFEISLKEFERLEYEARRPPRPVEEFEGLEPVPVKPPTIYSIPPPINSPILDRLKIIAEAAEMERMSASSLIAGENDVEAVLDPVHDIPLGVVSRKEWEQIIAANIKKGNHEGFINAENAINLMRRMGIKPGKEVYIEMMKCWVGLGDIFAVGRILDESEKAGHPASPETYSQVLNAYIARGDSFTAVQLLHELEDKGLNPTMESYTHLVRLLFSSKVPAHHAVAFDLFAHMRLVSHSIPDADAYTAVLEGCAIQSLPQPERALDLWREMTVENKIVPEPSTYAAVILACARVGSFYGEALRLFRQLLDQYNNARTDEARTIVTPTKATFDAILEATKRQGDIAKTRWILAEMVRFSEYFPNVTPDDISMKHVFEAYALNKPSIARSGIQALQATVERDKQWRQQMIASGPPDEREASDAPDLAMYKSASEFLESINQDFLTEDNSHVLEDSQEEDMWTLNSDGRPQTWAAYDGSESASPPPSQTREKFVHSIYPTPLPQSAHEVVIEANRLFSHVIHANLTAISETNKRTSKSTSNLKLNSSPLRSVRLSPQLVDGFMQVHYRHSKMSFFIDQFNTIYSKAGVQQTGESYHHFFTAVRQSKDYDSQIRLMDQILPIWQKYEQWANRVRDEINNVSEGDWRSSWELEKKYDFSYRTEEGCWVQMINYLTTIDALEEAHFLVGKFHKKFPPSDITFSVLQPIPSRSLINLTPIMDVLPDPLPPILLFKDVRRLHNRFAKIEHDAALSHIRKVCRSYESKLQSIRDNRLMRGTLAQKIQEDIDANSRLTGNHSRDKPKSTKLERGFVDMEALQGDIDPTTLRRPKAQWTGLDHKIYRKYGQEGLKSMRDYM